MSHSHMLLSHCPNYMLTIDKLFVSFIRIFYFEGITHKITNCFKIKLDLNVLGAY
jgi:hypothetical protein